MNCSYPGHSDQLLLRFGSKTFAVATPTCCKVIFAHRASPVADWDSHGSTISSKNTICIFDWHVLTFDPHGSIGIQRSLQIDL